jgi:hypothetical protein
MGGGGPTSMDILKITSIHPKDQRGYKYPWVKSGVRSGASTTTPSMGKNPRNVSTIAQPLPRKTIAISSPRGDINSPPESRAFLSR